MILIFSIFLILAILFAISAYKNRVKYFKEVAELDDKYSYIRKLMNSCTKLEQLKSTHNWGFSILKDRLKFFYDKDEDPLVFLSHLTDEYMDKINELDNFYEFMKKYIEDNKNKMKELENKNTTFLINEGINSEGKDYIFFSDF